MSDAREVIVVCDDDEGRVRSWADRLREIPDVDQRFRVEPLATGLDDTLAVLEGRRGAARDGSAPPDREIPFDNAAILIVDYDLLKIAGSTTGERISYLARCFSHCGLIVALNQFGQNSFDLTLRGHPESFADLNLGSDQLPNVGLWGEDLPLFRPWVWPILPAWLDKHRRRVQELGDAMGEPILPYLNLSAEELSRTAKQFLEADGSTPTLEVTFAQFVASARSAVRPKDSVPPEFERNVASARIAKWIERLVFPGQDILVDAPHLASRFPSLMAAAPQEALPGLTSMSSPHPPGLRGDDIAGFQFARDAWTSRAAWHWRDLSTNEAIPEVVSPWEKQDLDQAFCEDISRFVTDQAVREFVADLPTPFVRRFVIDPDAEGGRPYRDAVRDVAYRPIERLAL